MNRQILFFDIDGTLVDSTTHIVPASTRAALQKLKKAGHILCISTGRSLQSVTDGHFDELIDWDIFLCNNGQAIYNHDKSLLHMTPIPRESVEAHSGCGNAERAPLLIMGKKQILTRKPNAYVITSAEFFKESIPDVEAYDGSDVIMMIAYGPMGYAYEEYMAIPSVDVLIGQSTYADVVLKGFSKAIGIRFILDHFQMQDYLAFGDSLNDVEMLQHARIGVAMGNAHEEAKRAADIITRDVSEDGIYHALRQMRLLDL